MFMLRPPYHEDLYERTLSQLSNMDYVTSNTMIIVESALDLDFSFASDFLENIIPVQNLASSMKLGSLGLQTVLKSKKSFERLTFVKTNFSPKEKYYSKYKDRDTAARKSYLEGLRKVSPSDAVYMIDLVRNPELLNDLAL